MDILDDVKLDPKSPANINYVKARCAIEDAMKNRTARRSAKMVVIAHLKGEIHHPNPAEVKRGATKQVVFADNTKARF
jgi:hypothetical protein